MECVKELHMTDVEEIVYNALFCKFYKTVCAKAYVERRNWSDANDIAQETFVVLAQNIGKVMNYERPDIWLLKVAYHQIMHYYRNMHNEAPLSTWENELTKNSDFVPVEIELPDFLSGVDRQIFRYHLYGFTLEEVARMVKMNPNTCRGHHSKIMKKMEKWARKKNLLK